MHTQIPVLSTTARYALAAVAALGRLEPGVRVSSAELARLTGVPTAYLAKVLAVLSRGGVVDGLKGHHGGYRLARDPGELHLFEVVDALGDEAPRRCGLGAGPCDPDHPCALHDRWLRATEPVERMLCELSVADVVRAGRSAHSA